MVEGKGQGFDVPRVPKLDVVGLVFTPLGEGRVGRAMREQAYRRLIQVAGVLFQADDRLPISLNYLAMNLACEVPAENRPREPVSANFCAIRIQCVEISDSTDETRLRYPPCCNTSSMVTMSASPEQP